MGSTRSEFGEKKTEAICPCCGRKHWVMANYTGRGVLRRACMACKYLFTGDYTPDAYPKTSIHRAMKMGGE